MCIKSFVFLGALLAAPSIASAAPVEISFMNCSDIQNMAPPDIGHLVAWLRVTRGDSRNVGFFDAAQVKIDTVRLSAYCRTHAKETLPWALQLLFARQ